MFERLFRERRRSQTVRSLGPSDAVQSQALQRFVEAAAAAFAAPISGLSLIHDDRQSVLAAVGFPLGCMARADGLCGATLDAIDVLETCEPDRDPRFAALPCVAAEPHIRYYIGAPLRLLNGIEIGALCVADTARRTPASSDQRAFFLGLARQAALTLENRLDTWEHAA